MEFPILLSIILLTGFGFISNVSGANPVNKFQVKDGNSSCILAEFSGEVFFEGGKSLVLKDGNSDGSQCGLHQMLQVLFTGDGHPRLDLVFSSDGNETELKEIQFSMNATTYQTNSSALYTIKKGNTWKCDTGLSVALHSDPPGSKVQLQLESVKLDAYRETNNDKYENEISCSADSSNNKTVPMIIAFVLAGMVIIMLVGYVILRRKEDKSVYQTV